MGQMFQRVKGFQDILGDDCLYWQYAEDTIKAIFKQYSISEVRLPVLERTEVFNRGIGGTTDIVEKEMFTMDDSSGGGTLSLRPEATAGIVRAYIENGLYNPPILHRFYCIGPMFRKENPQKGRFRQFVQGDVEFLGSSSPLTDADIIGMLMSYFDKLGLGKFVKLELNSVGCPKCRPSYQKKLIDYFNGHAGEMCEDCNRRLERNPLRVLDCKQQKCREFIKNAPIMLDELCDECKEHFDNVQYYLGLLNVPFVINPLMVRGLDYYVRTAFEVVTDKLGAASAVGGGGRYDGLVETLGGPSTPGIGFAIGMDRVVALLKEVSTVEKLQPLVYVVTFGDKSLEEGLKVLTRLRSLGIVAEIDYAQKGLKNQMKKADRSGAKYAIIMGEDELARGVVSVRTMANSSQEEMSLENFYKLIKE